MQQVPRWLAWVGHGVLLFVALSFVVTVTYLPHMGTAADHRPDDGAYTRLVTLYAGWADGSLDDYEYFVHVDSLVHWVAASAAQDADSLRHPNPFDGRWYPEPPLSLRGLVHEKGFLIAFAAFQDMTGIGWADLIRLFPALWAGVTASLVWVALRPWKGAPLAASFVALVPTSARFLGIGFFVPVGIGLAWVACTLALLRRLGKDRSALVLVLFLGGWSFFIHLIIGWATVLLIALSWPVQLAGERRNVILLALALALPLLGMYDAFRSDLDVEVAKFRVLPIDFTIFDQVGIAFLIAWAFGLSMIAAFPPRGDLRMPLVAAGAGSLVIFSMIIVNVAFDLHKYALYDRWHQVFVLLAGLPVAYGIVAGLTWIQRRLPQLPRKNHHGWFMPAVPLTLVATLVGAGIGGAVAAGGLQGHLDEGYYRIMDDDDWAMFTNARSLGPTYEVFLTHPWQAPVFTAMSGKFPYTRLDPGVPPYNGADYIEYKLERYRDPVWLVERDISIILDPTEPVDDGTYVRLAPGVWILNQADAEALSAIRNR